MKKSHGSNNIVITNSVVFMVVGAISITGGIFLYKNTKIFLKTALTTEGQVVVVEKRRDSEGKTFFYPHVEFQDQLGKDIEFTSGLGSNPPSQGVGDIVTVYYNPDDPYDAKISSFMTMWGFALMFSAMGGLFFLVGFAVLIYWLRTRKRNQPLASAENSH